MSAVGSRATPGLTLRWWRQRRRLSQLELAAMANVSTRHLSYVETGKAAASQQMLMRLADHLAIPPRDRNQLLLAAGFAPVLNHTSWDAEEMTELRSSLHAFIESLGPNPAVIVDRHWNIITANRATAILTDGIDRTLMEPPVNMLRLSLHPDGIRRRSPNAGVCTAHLVARLRHQAHLDGDVELQSLLAELDGYASADDPSSDGGGRAPARAAHDPTAPVSTLHLATQLGEIRLYTTIATLAAPLDVTAAELAIETFVPADDDSRRILHELVRKRSPEAPR